MASTDEDELEEELKMIESEDNVELGSNSRLYYAMIGNVAPLIDKWKIYLSKEWGLQRCQQHGPRKTKHPAVIGFF